MNSVGWEMTSLPFPTSTPKAHPSNKPFHNGSRQPYTSQYKCTYFKVQTYGFDGLRIDAAKSIPYFYAEMVNNVTDSYAIGEVFDGDAGYACQYQSNGLDAFLNFPLYNTVLPPLPPGAPI